MERTQVLTLTNENIQPEYIYIIYSEEGCYLKECSTLSEVAKFFRVSKQALANHLRRTKQDKTNFKYREYSIEYFDINGEY